MAQNKIAKTKLSKVMAQNKIAKTKIGVVVDNELLETMKVKKVVATRKRKTVQDKTLATTAGAEQITEGKRQYIYSVGKRKAAIATIRLFENGQGQIIINNKDYKSYFPLLKHQNAILSPLVLCAKKDIVDLSIMVKGGGTTGQVDGIKHGIAKGLLKLNLDARKSLKSAGLLTRDSRIKERKKYGLKGARRAPQWQKR